MDAEEKEILARLDERTRYIKEKLDDHCKLEEYEKLPQRVSKLETNVSWIKRIGIGVPSALGAIIAGWMGLN